MKQLATQLALTLADMIIGPIAYLLVETDI